ncbi:MAG: restriction endonuclease subunit S [Candidatus Firestonebacteria bacterium]
MNIKNTDYLQITKDTNGNQAVMVRVDKTAKDLVDACETDTLKWSRWDSKYYSPVIESITEIVKKKYEVKYLYELRKEIIVGDHIRSKLNEKYTNSEDGVLYLKSDVISNTGLQLYKVKKVTKNTYERLKRSQPHKGDLLVAFSGSIGKMLLIEKNYGPAVTCDLCIFRVKYVNPFYLYVYLKSNFGKTYMDILKNGTGIEHLNSDEFQLIKIPIISEDVQNNIEKEYKSMSAYHDKAMETKSKGDETGYTKNIEKAETMLKDLIARTEAVIRGERKDIV